MPSAAMRVCTCHGGLSARHPAPVNRQVNNTIKTIAQMLKTVGYTTYASGKTAPLSKGFRPLPVRMGGHFIPGGIC